MRRFYTLSRCWLILIVYGSTESNNIFDVDHNLPPLSLSPSCCSCSSSKTRIKIIDQSQYNNNNNNHQYHQFWNELLIARLQNGGVDEVLEEETLGRQTDLSKIMDFCLSFIFTLSPSRFYFLSISAIFWLLPIFFSVHVMVQQSSRQLPYRQTSLLQ